MRLEAFTGLLDKLLQTARSFEEKAEGYVPFTPSNVVDLTLDKRARSILDLGCGKGNRMKFFNRRRKFYSVGADIFAPYMETCRRLGSHHEYVLCDIRKLPFRRKSFDIVLGLGVLEHQTKGESERLLADMESLARRQVVILIPNGPVVQLSFEGNPYQEHRSAWNVAELRERGYKIRASGLRYIPVSKIRSGYLLKFLDYFWHFMWVVSGPLVYFVPTLGGEIIGVRNVDKHESAGEALENESVQGRFSVV